jgi:soluble lytic murein transglycosylase-like protein
MIRVFVFLLPIVYMYGKTNVSPFDSVFRSVARDFNLNYNLPKAIGKVESNWAPSAIGAAGEIGICQILPSTGIWMGFNILELFIPERNIECTCKYLRYQYGRYETTTEVIAAYNAGSVIRNSSGSFVNQEYVDKVSRHFRKFNLGSFGGVI